jgi:hypothetical protein
MNFDKIKPTESIVTEERSFTVNASFTFSESDLSDPEIKRFFDMLSEDTITEDEPQTLQ